MSIGADSRGSGQPGANPSYRVVRELGKRAQRAWAAVREKSELVVVQRFTKAPRPASAPFGETAYDKTGAAFVAADAMGIILRDARCLSKNWHPNVSRVRHVDLVGDDLTIATELVDGATLADLIVAARAKRTNKKDPVLPFQLLARVIVDVLGGLHGVHGLRDGMNAALNVFHGELCPANIIVGKDGVARIAHVFRPRPVKIEARSEGLGYAAPEALGGEPNQDARADIYSVGAVLWEGLTGLRLFEETDPQRVAQRQREEDLEPPNLPASSAFARLSEVATRALAFDPSLRFRTASEMATEIRRIAGTRLAPGSAVAQTVLELAGDRIRGRRAELDPSSSGARRAFGAASSPPAASSAKKPDADTTPRAPAQRDTQVDDDGDETPVDEPLPLTTRAGSDPMIAVKKPAASRAPAQVKGTAPGLAPPPTPSPPVTTAPGIAPPANPPTPTPRATPRPAPAVKVAAPRTAPAAPKPKEAPKPASPAPPPAREEAKSTPDDLFGPRGSDPNIVEVPLVAATATALARSAAGGNASSASSASNALKAANGDALAVAASREVALAEKSLVDGIPLLVQPPAAPFPLTPSVAPPSSKSPKEPDAIIVMPKLPASPFPLTPSAHPPALPRSGAEIDVVPISERIDVTSVDLIESARDARADSTSDLTALTDSTPEVAEAERESGAEPASSMALAADDSDADAAVGATRRRKKMTPIFAAVAGVMVLVLVVAGIASVSGSKESNGDRKTGTPASGAGATTTAVSTSTATASTATASTTTASTTTPTETATATATATATLTAAPAKTAEATPPTPAPAPDPTPEPAAVAPPKPTAQAAAAPAFVAPTPAPKPAPAAPAPAKKPKKSSYEPSGI